MQQLICRYILQWVEENIDTGRNISDLVQKAGYSRRTLESWFHRLYGITPGDYLFRRRMTRAAVMLRLTVMPVTEIAQLLHHSCNQNFAKAFRRFSGKTPTQYRSSKEWDLTILQSSLLFSDDKMKDVAICELTDRYLCGTSYFCSDSWLNNAQVVFPQQIKSEVTRLALAGGEDIYLSGRPVVSDDLSKNRKGHVGALITIGQLAEAETEKTIRMPGGRFCRYHFNCGWNEYYLYTNMCFIRLMSENKFHFSGGDCYVHFSGSPSEIINQVDCEVFIPVN
ncbi:AraC family transcriptional regulator [Salmonella enterica subsp. enterica serovar Havana]|nr:AraC family transcriptional regulator [Salmonella enterica]EBX0472604.1 AraC family transcriptional regulator [Salmonella enterica subsp. enterica serovar Havana]EBX8404908.1 AraC family transcriptional regulator [Salmonella enterica subsp. enterica serovar Oranienburg]EAW1072263.1 AraC family transcriptional regulator [Salmonella enterica]EAY1112507.1 helix-turn-helix transcriptional regulator [Salmonella enterica]